MRDKQELNMEEMGQVAGGWTFHSNGKYHTWLDGYEIKCPYCGNTSADVVKRIGASSFEVAFICEGEFLRSSIHMRCLREVFLPPLGQSQQKGLPR